jgi:ribose transport system ATP-binding protein
MTEKVDHICLQFKNISKRFFGIQALSNINLSVKKATILGLVGENGAGKSTLMNILGGIVQADTGEMLVNQRNYLPQNPSEAMQAGIVLIHQELNLFPNLSIADNLFLDCFPTKLSVLIKKSTVNEKTAQALKQVGLHLSPETLVEKLSPGERQLVEIAKGLSSGAQILIFDEPTTSLTAKESEHLFEIIQQLKLEGKTIIFISHILEDVLDISDEIAILKDGELVKSGLVKEFTTNHMIALMVGKNIDKLYPEQKAKPSSKVLLRVQNITQRGIVKNINFELKGGEILGLFGLMGSGRSELAKIIFGVDPFESGQIFLDGKLKKINSPQDSIRQKLALVTEDRREEGLLLEASVSENIALVSLKNYLRSNLLQTIHKSKLNLSLQKIISSLNIRSVSFNQNVKNLSGGNQQKVVLAKWLLSNPKIFILDEPTRGIDVGAKSEIYTIINQTAAQGSGVLFISSELNELIGLCDRILVMSNGQISNVFLKPDFNEENILRAAFNEVRVN